MYEMYECSNENNVCVYVYIYIYIYIYNMYMCVRVCLCVGVCLFICKMHVSIVWQSAILQITWAECGCLVYGHSFSLLLCLEQGRQKVEEDDV